MTLRERLLTAPALLAVVGLSVLLLASGAPAKPSGPPRPLRALLGTLPADNHLGAWRLQSASLDRARRTGYFTFELEGRTATIWLRHRMAGNAPGQWSTPSYVLGVTTTAEGVDDRALRTLGEQVVSRVRANERGDPPDGM